MDETLTMDTVLRRYADDIARAIRADGVVASCGEGIEVIVEDRAEIENAIKTAITKATGGVAVLVTVVRWRRRANTGRLMTGDIDFQISVHENPLFNRKGQFVLTAQCVGAEFLPFLRGGFVTIMWSAIASAFLSVGIVRRIRATRHVGLGLLAASVVKLLLFDTSTLATPGRVGVFAAVGVLLIAGAFLYLKFKSRFEE